MFALPTPRAASRTALAAVAAVAAAMPAAAAPVDHTAAQVARGVCSGQTRSTDEVGAALTRAQALKAWNAFIHLDEAGAKAAASKLDAAHRTARCRPLAGVPIVVKDNIEVAGLPSSAGTPALAGYVPAADAPVVARLRAAGAIVIGKTNNRKSVV